MQNQQNINLPKAPSSGGASSVLRNPTPENISFLAKELKAGELVAIPTETVYGLAADIFNESACRQIFKVKGRPFLDPLISHIHSWVQLDQIALTSQAAKSLADAFWPGPMTLILPKKTSVPNIVTADLPTVAIRMPRHPIARKLLKKVQNPLAAPSANPFGYVSPTTAQHVYDSLGEKIKYILDGGSSQVGIESTIVDLSNPDRIQILRPGSITKEQIESVLGKEIFYNKEKSKITAPGMLDQHYSPKTKLILFAENSTPQSSDQNATIFLSREQAENTKIPGAKFWLSESGDLKEIARSLFAIIRKLDTKSYSTIHLQKPKNEGIGLAINDRLTRAATK